jgi:DNA-binding transcriptional regulator LsrR (DeoR family)
MADRSTATGRQCIGIGLEDLKRAEEVIVVANGMEKAACHPGGVARGYVNVLISDSDTANAIIDLL